MKFVSGLLNGVLLDNVMTSNMEECSRVRASIAYADGKNMRLLEACKAHKKPLEFYGRYDHTVAMAPQFLKWFLDQQSPNYRCKLIPDVFHSKVIWWVDAGAYFGSANMSERAWIGNIEAGIFMNYEELVHNGIDRQLEDYFSQIECRSTPLSKEIYDEQLALSKQRAGVDSQDELIRRAFSEKRYVPKEQGLAAVNKQAGSDRRFAAFEKEWNSTLQIMRDIGSLVSSDKVRPHWIRADVPPSVQADQFLHAYYYLQVRRGNGHPFEEFHLKNLANPGKALDEAVQWWSASEFDYVAEKRHMHEWAPRVRALCAKDRLLKLNREELTELLLLIHAVRDHVSKLSRQFLGLSQSTASVDERMEAFMDWLAKQRSVAGNGVLQTFYYVIWGKEGFETESVTKRLWNGQDGDEWAIPHIGLSTLGELVGWARPDRYPPRNGRTSKALKALGYSVTTDL